MIANVTYSPLTHKIQGDIVQMMPSHRAEPARLILIQLRERVRIISLVIACVYMVAVPTMALAEVPMTVGKPTALTAVAESAEVEVSATEASEVRLSCFRSATSPQWGFSVTADGVVIGEDVVSPKGEKNNITITFVIGSAQKWHWAKLEASPTECKWSASTLKGGEGKEGKEGEKGQKGTTGEKGAKGEKGEEGATGEKGLTGEKGSTGQEGKTGATGPKGENGKSLEWYGSWSPTPEYKLLQAVLYNGSSYVALGTSKGEAPSSHTLSWELIAERGSTGTIGPEGKEGKEGVEGKVGKEGPEGKTGKEGPEGLEGKEGKEGKELELTNFKGTAAMEINELNEHMETGAWCIIGTLLAGMIGFMLYRVLRPGM